MTEARRTVFLQSAIAFVLCLLTATCGGDQPNLQVRGQVFVVAASGESVKLGSVQIAAIPEHLMMAFLEAKKAKIEAERAELRVQLEKAMSINKGVREDCARLNAAMRAFEEEFATAPPALILRKGKDLNSQIQAKCEALKPTAMELARADARLNYFPTSDFYFEGLPSGLATTITDADGRFSLSVPIGKFALSARTKRELSNRTEEYFWLIWISENQGKDLILSNYNLMDKKFPDAVVPVEALSIRGVLQDREHEVDVIFEKERNRGQTTSEK